MFLVLQDDEAWHQIYLSSSFSPQIGYIEEIETEDKASLDFYKGFSKLRKKTFVIPCLMYRDK